MGTTFLPSPPTTAAMLLGSRFVSGVLVAISAEARSSAFGEIEAALADLGRVFYYAGEGDLRAPVADELAFAERYLRLQALRFGERLAYEVSSDPDLGEVLATRLATFPFLERATAETLELSSGSAFITVGAKRRADGRPGLTIAWKGEKGAASISLALLQR